MASEIITSVEFEAGGYEYVVDVEEVGASPIVPEPTAFGTMYVALQNNAVGATNNFIARVERDEGNVGSWAYTLVNISKATYGTGFSSSYNLWVDEADDIMFIRYSTNNIWAFQLDGAPIVHLWTPDGTNDVMGATIDTINNRFYVMMRNDTGGAHRTNVLREYTYDGTYVGAVWSNTFGSTTSCTHLAYDDGLVYTLRAQSTTRVLFSINIATGAFTELGGSHTTSDANAGAGAASQALGVYFANYIGSNEIRKLSLPTPGSIETFAGTGAEDAGVIIDPVSAKIYWSDAQRSIVRANLDGSSEEDVIDFPSTGAGTYIYGISLGGTYTTGDPEPLAIISPITIRCGDLNYGPLEPVLQRTVTFRARDEARYLRGQFASAGAHKHLLNITRDAEILFRGYVDTAFQSHLAWHENPEFELNAYDGISLLDGFPWLVSGDKTFREILVTIYSILDLDLPCNIVMEYVHDGTDSGTEPPDTLRWRAEDWLPENSTYLDALITLCEAFNAQFFQARGAWWFVQRAERGAVMNVYPIDAAGDADTPYTLNSDYTAEDTTLLRDTTEVIEYPVTSLVTIKQQWLSRGLRNGGFELLNPRYWNVQGGFGAGLDGGWIMDTAGDFAEQEVQHTLMAISATRDKLVVHLDFEIEVDSSASGTTTVGNAFLDYLEIKLIEADGSVSYDDGATGGSNAWTGTPTYVQYPFLLEASAGTTVSESDLKWTTPAIPSSPCKIVIKFIYQANPNSDGDYINSFQINRAWVFHTRPDPEDDIERPDGFTYTQSTSIGGAHLEQEFILGDMYDRHIVPGVMQYYDGADWQFTTDWDALGQKFHRKRQLDLIAQIGERIPGLVFGHVWGEEVDILSSALYDDDGDAFAELYVPVYEERVIHPVGAHSVMTAGYQLLGVSKYVPSPFTVLYAAVENNLTSPTNHYIYRFARDEGNIGSWSFTSIPFSTSTYSGGTPSRLLVDEADDIMFIFFGSATLYSFRLDGTPIQQVTGWTGIHTRTCIDTINNKLYFVQTTDARTATIREYDYDGSNERVVYTNEFSSTVSPHGMAVGGDGNLYISIYVAVGTGDANDALYKIAIATGSSDTVVTHIDGTSSTGRAAADISAGKYIVIRSADEEFRVIDIPTASSWNDFTPAGVMASPAMDVDWMASRIYWRTTATTIRRVAYDGSNEEVVAIITDSNRNILDISFGR